MSDLISRSALLKQLSEAKNDEIIKAVIGLVQTQPTAYDVDKVVARMEKEKEIHTEYYNISLYKEFPDVKRRYEQIQLVIDKDIEIVRKGGVNENS